MPDINRPYFDTTGIPQSEAVEMVEPVYAERRWQPLGLHTDCPPTRLLSRSRRRWTSSGSGVPEKRSNPLTALSADTIEEFAQ